MLLEILKTGRTKNRNPLFYIDNINMSLTFIFLERQRGKVSMPLTEVICLTIVLIPA